MAYLNLKALHIIFVVTWFSGLFYIVRLFIYQTEVLDKSQDEQKVLSPYLRIMAKRLWLAIAWPSAILTLLFGTLLVVTQPNLLKFSFMHVKLCLVFLLFVYHLICHKQYALLQKGQQWMSSNQLRLWNELATLFLVSIVFVIVLKNEIDWLYGTIGLVTFALLIGLSVRIYKKIRN